MKNMLLLLLALTVVPVWAADTAGAPAANPAASESAGQAAQPGKETPKKAHKKKKQKQKKAKSAATESVTANCPLACQNMNCPPPGGPYKLCCPVAPFTQTCP